ncbi:tetratricopeptide repeat protein [Altererythrobacter sp. MF3-039]|uniref:tetratricopeptide repeat protein n=1 Tax=Altererythrobacter sp. MF3-039 TaxID=3252901 RepID=UPI00390CC308
MARFGTDRLGSPLETIMRYAPAAAALSLLLAVSASVGSGADRAPDPRAVLLLSKGDAAMAADNPQAATDAYEAALAVDPAYTPILLKLAEAARAEDLQGKAIRYYREALVRDPDNFAAMSGEGEALLEKGAVEKARRNLAKLQSMCGERCNETQRLAVALERGPQERVLTAEALLPDQVVVQN